MKKLFGFAVAVLAIGMIMNGCKPDKKGEPKEEPKKEEEKETFVPENDFDILFNGTEAKMYLKGSEIHNGDTIVTDEFDVLQGSMAFVGFINISSLAPSALPIQIKEHRNYDLTNYSPTMCLDMCMNSNGKADQTWDVGSLEPEAQQEFDAHIEIKEEALATPATLVTDFEVTDGKCSAKFVVKYVYVPEEE
ncbi:MAG: hypothetical protein MJZ95_06810 [Paludibacteraceae bacterium]|nr:hypothetical protein [Paludibacteraceae bacterium]